MLPRIARVLSALSALALLAVPLLLAVGLAAAPAALAGDPCYHGFVLPARTEGAETQVKVAPCAFAPTVTHVAVGATVTFFNGPDFTHLVTGANQEWGSRDVELKPGATVSYRFDRAGVYPYACALHRGMSGTIIVGGATAAGGSTSGTGTTDTTSGGATAGGAAAAEAGGAGDAATASAGGPGLGAGVAAGAAAGLLIGAGATVLATRRRRPEALEAARPAD